MSPAFSACLAAVLLLGSACPQRHSTEELDALTDAGTVYLNAQQEKLRQDFKLRAYERYDWSQENGDVVFSSAGVPKVIARSQVVGDFSGTSNTWLWSWANDSIEKELTVEAEKVRAYGKAHHLRKLTEAQWPTTLNDGWCMTGIAAKLAHAKGAYRIPDEKGGALYLIFTDVRWAPESSSPRGDKETRR